MCEPTSAELENFDLRHLPAEFFHDPYPWYRGLRALNPVHVCPDDSLFLTAYDDIARVYRDPVRFISDKRHLFGPKFGVGSAFYRHHTTSLVFSDPPYHTRVRQIIMNALHPRMVRALEADVTAVVDRLLDDLEPRDECDLVTDFAAPIPLEIIGNLLRVPRSDRGPLRQWSLAILGALEFMLSDTERCHGERAVEDFSAYLTELIADRRAQLSNDPTDLLSALIRGTPEGDQCTTEELIQNCIFLLNAGHETTTNLIANGVYALLSHPEELQRLRDNRGLIKPAIEECLRFESPNQLGNRELAVDAAIGTDVFPAGTQIVLCIGAANRDPSHFPDPDRFDITRSPNKHLAFASGIHMCAGMAVARLEGRVAVGRLIDRFPQLRLVAPASRQARARFRGFATLPITTRQ